MFSLSVILRNLGMIPHISGKKNTSVKDHYRKNYTKLILQVAKRIALAVLQLMMKNHAIPKLTTFLHTLNHVRMNLSITHKQRWLVLIIVVVGITGAAFGIVSSGNGLWISLIAPLSLIALL